MKQIIVQPVKSSQMAAMGHGGIDTLEVHFPRQDGSFSRYQYAGVSPEMFKALQGAESIGSHFCKHIKSAAYKHPFTRLADKPAKGAA